MIPIMPERLVLVILSAVVVVGAVGTVVWVLASRQGLSLDTLFLIFASLTVALVFAVYAKSEIDQARADAQAKPAAKVAAPRAEA
jgi:hypothetical protein